MSTLFLNFLTKIFLEKRSLKIRLVQPAQNVRKGGHGFFAAAAFSTAIHTQMEILCAMRYSSMLNGRTAWSASVMSRSMILLLRTTITRLLLP